MPNPESARDAAPASPPRPAGAPGTSSTNGGVDAAMHDHIDELSEERRADVGCPLCGSARVSFRKLRHVRRSRWSRQRALVGTCRECWARWTGALLAHPENLDWEPDAWWE